MRMPDDLAGYVCRSSAQPARQDKAAALKLLDGGIRRAIATTAASRIQEEKRAPLNRLIVHSVLPNADDRIAAQRGARRDASNFVEPGPMLKASRRQSPS
jgi:hypothetical protein